MKRVICSASYGKDCVPGLNAWLLEHPQAELIDIKPILDERHGRTELFCVVDIPDNIDEREWSKHDVKVLGLKGV